MSDLDFFIRGVMAGVIVTGIVSMIVFDFLHNNRPHDTFYDERDRDNKE